MRCISANHSSVRKSFNFQNPENETFQNKTIKLKISRISQFHVKIRRMLAERLLFLLSFLVVLSWPIHALVSERDKAYLLYVLHLCAFYTMKTPIISIARCSPQFSLHPFLKHRLLRGFPPPPPPHFPKYLLEAWVWLASY